MLYIRPGSKIKRSIEEIVKGLGKGDPGRDAAREPKQDLKDYLALNDGIIHVILHTVANTLLCMWERNELGSL